MRISVALCTYNGSRFLPEQLFSIQRQTRPPDELVVCDDGSIDETMAILQRYVESVGFPVHIHRNVHNLRTTKNFEKGIGLCQGDVIVTADQDDVWYPDKLLKIEQAFVNHDPGLVFSDADLIDGDGRPRHERLWRSVRYSPRKVASLQRGDAFASLLRRALVTGATMAFRADLRALVLPIPEDWIHDEWIALIIAAAHPLLAITQPLIQYRVHAGNQIGVGDGDPTIQAAVQGIARQSFVARSEQFSKLRDALGRAHTPRADRLKQIDEKISHFLARARMPRSRLARIPSVAGELVRLRYSRYSGTTLAFLRDLVAST